MISLNDTLILYGEAFDTVNNAWGLQFSKIDTLGNIISQNLYTDSLGDNALSG